MPPLRRANACRAAFAIALLGPGVAAQASCEADPPIAPMLLQQYLTTPAALLYAGPQGVEQLRATVRRLAPTGIEAVKAILSTAVDASPAQQLAIGAGLAEAARICMTQDSVIVQRIKNAVRSSGSSVVEKSFVAESDKDAPSDAASSSANAVGTHRFAAERATQLPQNLMQADPHGDGKLPDPFGAPDGWR